MSANLPARTPRGLQSWLQGNPLESLRGEIEDLIHRFSNDFDGEWTTGRMLPSMDFAETDKAFEVKLDVPGFKPDELKVEVQGDVLTVQGEHKEEKEEKDKTFHRVERRSGTIRRRIQFPSAVDQDKIVAQCRDGVLTVSVPKTEASRTKQIAVKN